MKRLLLSFFMALFWFSLSYADTITLAWDANTETDLVGYNIYYTNGPFDDLTEWTKVDVPLTSLADVNNPQYALDVPDGDGIKIVATAYDNEGCESGPSNQLTYWAITRLEIKKEETIQSGNGTTVIIVQ